MNSIECRMYNICCIHYSSSHTCLAIPVQFENRLLLQEHIRLSYGTNNYISVSYNFILIFLYIYEYVWWESLMGTCI
jgi:hypothetical protein